MIQFNHVDFSYGTTELMKDISFTINKGDFVAIVGANGAGKSTISKLCNGLLKPDSGDVLIKGMNTKTTKSSKLAKFIGYLFQNPDRQICQTTIYNEIMFGLNYTVSNPEERIEKCNAMLEKFGFDKEKDPFNISRGERQRVALASILACEPEILILDEPTTGLDYRECMQIMYIIQNLNANGTTILMITHDMEIVQDFAKRVLVLTNGRLIGDGSCHEIMTDRKLLESTSVLPAQIPILAMMLGDDFKNIFSVEDMLRQIEFLTGKGGVTEWVDF
jgi:energy-coupling factor transport system ATP-binding protein